MNSSLWKKNQLYASWVIFFSFIWLNIGRSLTLICPTKGPTPLQFTQSFKWSSSTFTKRWLINHLLLLSSEHQIFPCSLNHCYNQTNWRSSKLLFVWDGVNLLPSSLYSTVFSMRAMLITHPRLRCCWAMLTLSQGLLSFSCCPASKLGRSMRIWEETQPGSFLQLAKGYSIPYDVMLSI